MPLFSASANRRAPGVATNPGPGTPGSISGPISRWIEAERRDDRARRLASADRDPCEPVGHELRRQRAEEMLDRPGHSVAAMRLLDGGDALGIGRGIDRRGFVAMAANEIERVVDGELRRTEGLGLDQKTRVCLEMGVELRPRRDRTGARQTTPGPRSPAEARAGRADQARRAENSPAARPRCPSRR